MAKMAVSYLKSILDVLLRDDTTIQEYLAVVQGDDI